MARAMAPAAYPRVALCDGLRRRKGSAFFATAAVKRQIAKTLTRRAGPALPSYLALLHAGFSVPRVLPPGRWALTPPFHPYQCDRAKTSRRFSCAMPPCAFHRRYIFCGTFRERIAFRKPKLAARSPPGVTRRVALDGPRTRDGVRTFLPPCHLAMAKPAITRLTRWRQL